MHDFLQNFQDAPHGRAILFKIFSMLRVGARFSSKFTGRTARERDFLQKFEDAPHGSAIFFIFLQNVNEEDELERSSLIWN